MHPDDLPSVAWFLGIQPIKNEPDHVSAVAATDITSPNLKVEGSPANTETMKTKSRKRTARYVWGKNKEGSSEEEDQEEDFDINSNTSYTKMIANAIKHHPNQEATLQEIYTYLYSKYQVLRQKRRFWKNSVRQNLRTDKFFVRVRRNKDMPTKWKMDENPAEIDEGKRKRRNRNALVNDSVVKYLEEQHNKNKAIAPSDISLFEAEEAFLDVSATNRTSSSHEGSTENGICGFVEYDRFTPILQPEENWAEIGLEEIDPGQTNQYFPKEDFVQTDPQALWNSYEYSQPRYEYGPSSSSLEFYNISMGETKCTPLPSSNTLLERLRPETSLNERFSEPYAHISW